MEHLRVLNTHDIRSLHKLLKDQFGVDHTFPYVFLMNNKKKVHVLPQDIGRIDYARLRVDALGLYFCSWDETIRLSIEGSQLVGPFAAHHILDLNKSQVEEYLKGNQFDLASDQQGLENGVYLVRHQGDFFGCCKLSDGRLFNFVAKARRIKVMNA
jgi:NOL1/NOP2/fmu family ribosome biogenesis protein